MPKARSPEYPAISLKEAIEKVRLVWSEDYQNKLPRQIVAEHMGYKGLNGGSLPVLSAASKYGLLEGRGDETRVSDLALTIFAHEPGNNERREAIKTAASRPELFAELDAKFQGGKASDAAIRSYLLTQKFIPSAADAAVRSYRDTKQLVEAESQGHTTASEKPEFPLMQPSSQQRQQHARPPEVPGHLAQSSQPAPMRVAFDGSQIEVSACLSDVAAVDRLIRALEANKVLLEAAVPNAVVATPAVEPTHVALPATPLPGQGTRPPSEGIPFMITNAQKVKLRDLGFSEAEISAMTPTEAHTRIQTAAARPAN